MIPKIIHCVWLSGDEKPATYQRCMKTWAEKLPSYEIKEWSLATLPNEVLEHSYVKTAIQCKKWAYATDYIRLWALHQYGGFYMDMDVMVFKPLDAFLQHRFVTSIELLPESLYRSIREKKKELIGLGLEAAVMGSEPHHPFLQKVMDYYQGMEFINDPKYYYHYIMPRVLTRVAVEEYGFRLLPVQQVLKEGIYIYSSDVFSSIHDISWVQAETLDDVVRYCELSPIRYTLHLCAHGWWEGFQYDFAWKVKNFILNLFFGGKNPLKK